jgi:antagonist of KipI
MIESKCIISVTDPGLFSTIQDEGRDGWQGQGVSVSGSADLNSMRIANVLVGNKPQAPVLEFVMQGPTLTFSEDCVVAFCGAKYTASISETPLPQGRPVRVHAGTTLEAGRSVGGMFGYLAVSGGLKIDEVMGSAATDTNNGFGGLEGRTLKVGDKLSVAKRSRNFRNLKDNKRYSMQPFITTNWGVKRFFNGEKRLFRFIPSLQWNFLPNDIKEVFLSETFRVTSQSNRMGVRLVGCEINMASDFGEPSQPVAMGTIQIPPDGQPIILSVDRQTVGGYPSMGVVISADRTRFVQSQPGASIKFVEVSLVNAQNALISEDNSMKELRRYVSDRVKELD